MKSDPLLCIQAIYFHSQPNCEAKADTKFFTGDASTFFKIIYSEGEACAYL